MAEESVHYYVSTKVAAPGTPVWNPVKQEWTTADIGHVWTTFYTNVSPSFIQRRDAMGPIR